MNGRTNSSGTTINDLEIPLDPCTDLIAVGGNGQVSLTWTDPKDKYATPEGEAMEDTDQLVSVWAYTRIVRKTGSAPASPNDGVLVVESSVRNQYQSTAYVDSGLTNDTTYYYGVFAYNEDGVVSPGTFTSAQPQAGTPLANLAEGTLIKIMENGSPVEFYLAKHNYESGLNGAGRELMVRKDVHSDQVWRDPSVNAYAVSDLDSWFNSTYKNMLDADIRSLIGTTKIRYTHGNAIWTVTTLGRSIFALSLTELGRSDRYANKEGSALPIASTLRIAYRNGSAATQWTRSPSTEDARLAWRLNSDGNINNYYCSRSGGSRPAFTLPSDALVDTDLNVIPA